MTRPFRFGASVRTAATAAEWRDKARRVEQLGFSTLLVADHLGGYLGHQLAMVPALVAAADATTTLRVGSFVACNDFRPAALLAKEAATIDLLSDGRFELGIGAGWLRDDYDAADLAFDPPAERIARLERSIAQIVRLLEQDGLPRPVQTPRPPLLVGGGGRGILQLAARAADIVAIGGRGRTDGSGMDRADMLRPVAERIAWIRDAAGERFDALELNLLVQRTRVTTRPREELEQLASELGLAPDNLGASAQVLVGGVQDIVERLLGLREEHGISYVTVFDEDSLDAFAPVVTRLVGS